ncbi:hypothetical protein C4J98_4193 [Pseudomonas orientalis]|uniref:hypothetical protein n=1 Tax=Pseudomonas TaxID=286 RepID=UPI0008129280|nr:MULTISPECIES: hypothetical protein [Pseudomonas]AZE85578.1 hypothetical protein C4J98_4193 [Pseudomonas orientalis]CRM48252.1 hypothetical protein [Pseudomonas sp. 28 E 9]
MKVLVSQRFQDKLGRPETLVRFSFEKIIEVVERLTVNDLARSRQVQQIRGVNEEIYVVRVDGFRVFFTRQNDAFVLLDAEFA